MSHTKSRNKFHLIIVKLVNKFSKIIHYNFYSMYEDYYSEMVIFVYPRENSQFADTYFKTFKNFLIFTQVYDFQHFLLM